MRIIGALALGLAVAGCSAIKLGYNNLPELAYWWLDAYFDFDDAQTVRARQELARLQQWHRAQELPQVQALLQKVEAQAAGDLTPAQACAVVEEGRARVLAVAAQAEGPLAEIGASLAPRQLQHLARHFARTNADWRADWIEPGPAGVRDKRFKQLESRLETAYGRLDDGQRALLRRHLEASSFDPRRLLAERERRQADTLATLRALQAPGLAPAQARALVRGLLERSLAAPEPAMRAHQERLLQESCALVAAIHNAASPGQRQAAAQRLRAWQRDLGELAAQR